MESFSNSYFSTLRACCSESDTNRIMYSVIWKRNHWAQEYI